MGSTQITPLGSYRGSSPADGSPRLELGVGLSGKSSRRWVRFALTTGRQLQDAESVSGAQMRQALRVAEQEARKPRVGSPEDVKAGDFWRGVAFLDESVAEFRGIRYIRENWPRLPLQSELFGHQLAGGNFLPGTGRRR